MRPLCRSSGQASVEYIVLWVLVALVLGSAAALTSGGIGPEVVYGLEHGLCTLTGGPCPSRPRVVADLPPCPVHRSSASEGLDVSIAIVKLANGLAVLEERDSAGHVVVTFSDDSSTGLTAGIGAHFDFKGAMIGAALTGNAGIGFTAGRSWHLPSQAAADAFVRHYGSDQTVLGRMGNNVRRSCPVCQLLGWEPDTPPPADETFVEGGGRLGADASAGLGVKAEAALALASAVGRRHRRTGETTWYMRFRGEAAARAYAGFGAGVAAGGSVLVEYSTDAHGHPAQLTLRTAGRASTQSTAPRVSPWVDMSGRRRLTFPPFSGHGELRETESSLDLTDPRNRAAALSFVSTAAMPARAVGLAARIDDLMARLRAEGVSTVRTYRLRDTHRATGGSVALGAVVGGGVSRDTQALDLTGVYTRLPGLGYLPRADCLAI
jgi:hypothetical protein